MTELDLDMIVPNVDEISIFDMTVIKHLNDYLYLLISQLIDVNISSSNITGLNNSITLKNDEIGHSIHVHWYHYINCHDRIIVYGDPEFFIELITNLYVCDKLPEIPHQFDNTFRYLFACMQPSNKMTDYLSTNDIGIIAAHTNNKSYEIIRPCDHSKDLDEPKMAKFRGPKISRRLAINLVSNGMNVLRSKYFSDGSKWKLDQ